MHLIEGTLPTTTVLMTSAAGLFAFGAACYGARKELSSRQLGSWTAMTGFVFFAQMVNCSMGLGFSGHLLGAALLAVFFGPWAAMLSMGVVLTGQAVFLGDGSLSTLGANFLNMGLVAAWSAHFVFRLLQGKRSMLLDMAQVFAMLVAAYVSTVAASVSLGMMIEESLFASYAVIGVLEAVLSVAVFAVCIRLKDSRTGISVHARVAPIVVACLIALCFVPFSSQLPDALEKALEAPIGLVD